MVLRMIYGFEQSEPGWSGGNGHGIGRFGATSTAPNCRTNSTAPQQAAVTMIAPFGQVLATTYCGVAVQIGRAGMGDTMGLFEGTTPHLKIQTGTLTEGGAVTLANGAGTVLATGTVPIGLNLGNWTFWEFMATVADAGGRCVVRLNGVTIIDFTGDTRNGGTGAGLDSLRTLNTGTGSLGSGVAGQNWDDFYVCDNTGAGPDNTFLGDVRIETLRPNAPGAATEWTPGSAVANWTTVGEYPPSTTDFVGTAVTGKRDLYGLTDLLTTNGQVLGVRSYATVAKSDAGAPPNARILLRGSDGTVVNTDLPVLSTTYTTAAGTVRRTTPAGAAWSIAEVNAMQAGIESF